MKNNKKVTYLYEQVNRASLEGIVKTSPSEESKKMFGSLIREEVLVIFFHSGNLDSYLNKYCWINFENKPAVHYRINAKARIEKKIRLNQDEEGFCFLLHVLQWYQEGIIEDKEFESPFEHSYTISANASSYSEAKMHLKIRRMEKELVSKLGFKGYMKHLHSYFIPKKKGN